MKQLWKELRMSTSSKTKPKTDPYAGQITFKLPERLPFWPKKLEQEEAKEIIPDMYAKLVCSPPLGQATIVPPGQSVIFTVLLETEVASEKKWQLCLWHNLGAQDGEWNSSDFKAASDEVGIVGCNPNTTQFLELNFLS
jgi:hypothetical protein